MWNSAALEAVGGSPLVDLLGLAIVVAGYTCGVRGRLKSEEGYATPSNPYTFHPLRPLV